MQYIMMFLDCHYLFPPLTPLNTANMANAFEKLSTTQPICIAF